METLIHFHPSTLTPTGSAASPARDESAMRAALLQLERPLYALNGPQGFALGCEIPSGTGWSVLASAPALPIASLGDPSFQAAYGTRYAYYAGAMANAIASVEMVTALGQAGFLGSYGAAGMVAPRLEEAIQRIQAALPNGPYAFNLIYSPNEPAMERRAVELYLRYGVSTLEASAFLEMTPALVEYRLAGLSQDPSGRIQIKNRVIAKLSRKEVAARFLAPAPADLVGQLLREGRISEQQARLAEHVPMADDITVEADSGGHTDNRPLVCLVPALIELRDELQQKYQYPTAVRVGAAGGISTPASALAAFMLGAAYIATGSVNQACVEAGASAHTRSLLAQASMADVIMAPAADMFEMGVKVQVLKLGTMFPMRAIKLYDLYTRYNAIEEIPAAEREKVEKTIFRRSLDDVWAETCRFFSERDPSQVARAESSSHHKMALIFRWYLGLSSRWSNSGEPGREMDYQIWCGPSIGPFNDWTRGTYLAEPGSRHVADVARHILTGCAYLYRVQALQSQGVRLHPHLAAYRPLQPAD